MTLGSEDVFPTDADTRRKAWVRIEAALAELGATPEVLAAPGAWFFVSMLEEICENIGLNLSKDSFPDAMEKLSAGFGRFTAQQQHAERDRAKRWTQQQWRLDRGGFDTKREFAEVFVKRVLNEFNVTVSEKVLRDDWLKGL